MDESDDYSNSSAGAESDASSFRDVSAHDDDDDDDDSIMQDDEEYVVPGRNSRPPPPPSAVRRVNATAASARPLIMRRRPAAASTTESAGRSGDESTAESAASSAPASSSSSSASSSSASLASRAGRRAVVSARAPPRPVDHCNNYPPADGATQRYQPDACATALLFNSGAFGVTLLDDGQSGAGENAGRGIVAARDFREGETVGYIFGKFVTEDVWNEIVQKGRDSTWKPGEEDYVTPASQGSWRCISVPTLACGASMLLASEQCPMTFINQGDAYDDDLEVNVEIRIPAHQFEPQADPHPNAFQYLPFVATRYINAGEELFTDYGWKPEQWKEAERRWLIRKQQVGVNLANSNRDKPRPIPRRDAPRKRKTGDTSRDSSIKIERRRHALVQPTRLWISNLDQILVTIQYECCRLECHAKFDCDWVHDERSATRCDAARQSRPKSVADLVSSCVPTCLSRSKFNQKSAADRKAYANRLLEDPESPSRRKYHLLQRQADGSSHKVPVCQRFFSDVYCVGNGYATHACRRVELAARQKSRPDAESIMSWFRDLQQFHEYMPDLVGAGRDADTNARRSRVEVMEEAAEGDVTPPDIDAGVLVSEAIRHTGVQLPYPNRKEVYEHFVTDAKQTDEVSPGPDVGSPARNNKSPPSFTWFCTVWNKEFRHIRLRKHMRFAKCDTCIYWRHKIGTFNRRDEKNREGYRKMFQSHLTATRIEREYYHTKRSAAIQRESEWLSIIFDGADQGAYGE
jgi:hypothetical protein